MSKIVECDKCGEVELTFKRRERELINTDTYECQCGNIATFVSAEASTPSEMLLDLKIAIAEAIWTLDNDLFVSRAVNSRAILADVLDRHGWPDEDVVAERRSA